MRALAVLMICCAGCTAFVPIGDPGHPHRWPAVEPRALEPGYYDELFVVTRDEAFLLNGKYDGARIAGAALQAWRVTSTRIVIRVDETPQQTAARHGWQPVPVMPSVTVPIDQVLHVGERKNELARRTTFGLVAIGALVLSLVIVAVVST